MPERHEVTRFMRESAARLRRVAKVETQLSAELIKIAEEMEAEAAELEEHSMKGRLGQPMPDLA
jgi:hypothetical protein